MNVGLSLPYIQNGLCVVDRAEHAMLQTALTQACVNAYWRDRHHANISEKPVNYTKEWFHLQQPTKLY